MRNFKLNRLLAALSLSLGVMVPLFNSGSVLAAGETYKWVTNEVIHVTGGEISGISALNHRPGASLGFGEVDIFAGKFTHTSGCLMNVELLVGEILPADGQLNVPASLNPAGGSTCNQSIINRFNNTRIDIAGTRPAPRVKVTIKVWSPLADDQSPTSLTLRIMDASGSQLQEAGVSKQTGFGDPSSTSGGAVVAFKGAYYQADFSLQGGEYTVCSSNTNVLDCTGFTAGDYATQAACIEKTPGCYNFSVPSGSTASVTRIFNSAAVPAGAISDDLCDHASGLGDLNFIICPAIELTAAAAQRLDCLVINLLIIDTGSIFGGTQGTPDNDPDTLGCLINAGSSLPSENGSSQANLDTSNAFRTAWGVFRNIAYALLIIIGLVMVASQILGLEIFDAYTIRKMLPKLIAATIFVALSWNIMNFLFNASNDGAFALMELIKAPFKGLDAGLGTGPGDLAIVHLLPVLLAVGAVAGAAFLAILGLGGIAALALSVLLAVFTAFVLLAARNVVAYLLIVAAPLAIMCAAFEPFKKLFTLWKTLTITILLSVPAVAAVIQMSHVGALIAYMSDQSLAAQIAHGLSTAASAVHLGHVPALTIFAEVSGLGAITALIILISGYAMIWVIFKKLDQVTGQLGNIASSVTGRLQKALANYRNNTLKNRARVWQQGVLFNEGGRLGKMLNRVGMGVGSGRARSASTGRGFVAGMTDRESLTKYEEIGATQREEDPLVKAMGNDDPAAAVLLATGGIDTDESLIEALRSTGQTGVFNPDGSLNAQGRNLIARARAIGVNRGNALALSRLVMKNKARGVSAGNVEYTERVARLLSDGSESSYQRVYNDMAFWARSSGRADLGGVAAIGSGQGSFDARTGRTDMTRHHEGENTTFRNARNKYQEVLARTGDAEEANREAWKVIRDAQMVDGFGRLPAGTAAASHDFAVRQMLKTFGDILSEPAETSTHTREERMQAALALKEIHAGRVGGMSGTARDSLNTELDRIGIRLDENLDAQLAERVGGGVTGDQLARQARAWAEYGGRGGVMLDEEGRPISPPAAPAPAAPAAAAPGAYTRVVERSPTAPMESIAQGALSVRGTPSDPAYGGWRENPAGTGPPPQFRVEEISPGTYQHYLTVTTVDPATGQEVTRETGPFPGPGTPPIK